VRVLHEKVEALGGTIEGGKEVAELVIDDGHDVKGVRLINGEIIEADLIIVATGSWCAFASHQALSSLADHAS
jgi:glycine/D-amino acid oxidase-like deaminating enzyme